MIPVFLVFVFSCVFLFLLFCCLVIFFCFLRVRRKCLNNPGKLGHKGNEPFYVTDLSVLGDCSMIDSPVSRSWTAQYGITALVFIYQMIKRLRSTSMSTTNWILKTSLGTYLADTNIDKLLLTTSGSPQRRCWWERLWIKQFLLDFE